MEVSSQRSRSWWRCPPRGGIRSSDVSVFTAMWSPLGLRDYWRHLDMHNARVPATAKVRAGKRGRMAAHEPIDEAYPTRANRGIQPDKDAQLAGLVLLVEALPPS